MQEASTEKMEQLRLEVAGLLQQVHKNFVKISANTAELDGLKEAIAMDRAAFNPRLESAFKDLRREQAQEL
jgi:hypothetical protein